jgi:hypothetical protein
MNFLLTRREFTLEIQKMTGTRVLQCCSLPRSTNTMSNLACERSNVKQTTPAWHMLGFPFTILKKTRSVVARQPRVFRLKKIFSCRTRKPPNLCLTHKQRHRSSVRWAGHRPVLWMWGRRGSFSPLVIAAEVTNKEWVPWDSNSDHLKGGTKPTLTTRSARLFPLYNLYMFLLPRYQEKDTNVATK